MCCFSGSVDSVTSTRIFVRPTEGAGQIVIYQMNLRAPADLAMILPIPVQPTAGEDAVRFIALDGYRDFFSDLDRGWAEYDKPIPGALSASPRANLAVHDVGDFEASFVPRMSDFERLDERFRLPEDTWAQVPRIRDLGFVVFKLRGLSSSAEATPHPMAFEFPRQDPSQIVFPTVHIHDGRVHATASFDHALYVQTGVNKDPRMDEELGYEYLEDESPVDECLDLSRCAGTVLSKTTVYRRLITDEQTNQDIVLSLPR